jgi:hypothetical protein
MEGLGIVVFLVLLAVVIVFAVRADAKRKQERHEAFVALASRLGFQHFPSGFSTQKAGNFWEQLVASADASEQGRFLVRFDGWEPFGHGHSPETNHILYGHRGDVEWTLFDYSYKVTTSNGKTTTTTTHPYGVVAARLKYTLPPVVLSQESMLTRLFGGRDLNFEVEEFNRRYRVQTSDEQGAYALIDPKMIEYLQVLPVLHWQVSGPQILVHMRGTLSPQQIVQLMEAIEGFLERVPPFLREDNAMPDVLWKGPF